VSLYRDRAIVLRRHKLGEADRIVTLLTRHHGIVRAVAKGVRRTSSRFGARLEPAMHIDVQLATGRSLDIVTQVETIDAFAGALTTDYSAYTCATVALETAERLCGEEREPATQQYLLLTGALRAFSTEAHDRTLTLNSYLLRALAVAGYAPSFAECARCGAPGPHTAFSPGAGGTVGSARSGATILLRSSRPSCSRTRHGPRPDRRTSRWISSPVRTRRTP